MANRRHALINRPSGGASAEVNDLTAAVTWANVPDANITQSSVTQHQAALSITESQISDLGAYLLNIVEDTTPQLGGNLDAQSNSINTLASLTMDGTLTIQDALNTDSVAFHHDGTNFNHTCVNTDLYDILRARVLRLWNDGKDSVVEAHVSGDYFPYLEVERSNGTTKTNARWNHTIGSTGDYQFSDLTTGITLMQFYQGGNNVYNVPSTFDHIWQHAGNAVMRLDNSATGFFLEDGYNFRIFDATNVDSAYFQHGGTNFATTFTGTTHWNISSLGGAFWIRDGASLRVSDSTDADYVDFSHDGTDFKTDFTGTGYWDISGVTRVLLNATAASMSFIGMEYTGTNGYGQFAHISNTDGQSSGYGYSGSTSSYYPSSAWLWTDWSELNLEVDGTSGFVGIRDATALRIYDDTDAIYTAYSQSGVDHYIAASTGSSNFYWTSAAGYNFDNGVGLGSGVAASSTDLTRHLALYANSYGFNVTAGTMSAVAAGVRVASFTSSGEVRVYDALDTDYGAFSHDGTNFLTTFLNTSVWNLSGATALQTISGMDIDIRDNGLLRIRDSADTDYVEFQHNGTDFYLNATQTDWLRLNNFVGGMWVMDGTQIRIADATDLDYMRLYHDGTHFYMNAVNTGDIVLRDIQQITFDASSGTAPYNSTYTGIYFLSTGTAAASYYGLHNNFNQSGTGGPTTAYIEMSANGPTYGSYSGFRSHIYATTEDNQQTSFAITGDNGAFLNFWVLGGVPDTSIVEVYDGAHLRILNSAGTDYVDFNHDGTDFNADFTNTLDWDINGLADINLLAGTALKIWDVTNVESATLSVEATYTQLSSSNDVYVTGGVNLAVLDATAVNQIRMNATATNSFIESDVGNIRLRPANGIVEVITASTQNYLRIWDSTTVDYFQISESGSNTQMTTNNNNIQISTGGGIVELTNGQTFRVRDSGNTDNIAISHDGTDANIVGTNTLDINITGLTAGGFVRMGTAPLATATWTNVSEDVSDTCDYQYMNGVYFKDGTTGITLTLEASGVTTFEVGATTNIINAHATTGDITVNEGTGTTLYLCDGSTVTDTAGGCTVGPGGYATLYRHSATVYYIMGAGITA